MDRKAKKELDKHLGKRMDEFADELRFIRRQVEIRNDAIDNLAATLKAYENALQQIDLISRNCTEPNLSFISRICAGAFAVRKRVIGDAPIGDA